MLGQPTKQEQEIIDGAVKRLKQAVDADSHNRAAAIEDLNFVNGDQWDAGEKKKRADKGRPALQFNLLQKFVDQVCGDMLHNSPQIKIRPVDSKADINIAKIRQGIISNIEYLSNSKSIYGYGARQQVSCGYGAWRVLTRYTDDNPFVQEAYLESVRNPFLVYMDPDSKDQFYADAGWGFVMEKMTRDKFKECYPKGKWPSDNFQIGEGLSSEHWYDRETLTVAEYFTVETQTTTMIQLEDGSVVSEKEFDEMVSKWRGKNASLVATAVPASAGAQAPVVPQGVPPGPPPPQGMPPIDGRGPQPGLPQPGPAPAPAAPIPMPLAGQVDQLGPEPKAAKRRDTERRVIRHRTLTCMEILDGGKDGNVFPGKFIPIVLLKGKELNIEGKNFVFSLIRHAKDPQKMFNYWNTSAAETIALAPKTPWLGTAKQFEGYERDYAAANVENFPFLKYNADPDAPGPPQRNGPPAPPAAIFEMIRRGEDTIKSVIGLFNADVGAPGSEQTGAAITARQRPGDIGTYEFMVNMAGAVEYTGRILNDMIPEIYDSERDVRLRNMDETETFVPVNTTVGAAFRAVKSRPETYMGLDPARLSQMVAKDGQDAKFNDITVGKYDVVVTTGPSYATQRMEAAQQLMGLVQSAPQQMAVALDLIVRNLDFKDADELEARLRQPLLSAGVVKPKPGETVAPPKLDPAAMKAQADMAQIQSRTQIEQMRQQTEQMRLEEQKVRLAREIARTHADTTKKDVSVVSGLIESERKHALEAERVQMEKDRLDHQRRTEAGKIALQASKQFHERQKPKGGK